jgi:hypothetical protein
MLAHTVSIAGVVNTDVISWNAIGNWTQWYSSIADEFSDVIAAHFAGHTHKDEKRIFYGSDGRAAAVAHVLPSVTTQINRNPSVMQFKYNRTTFELLDYTVYYSNVTRANEDGYFTFSPFYSALEYYGLADLSAPSWHRLFENMRCDVSVFDKYLKVRGAWGLMHRASGFYYLHFDGRLRHITRALSAPAMRAAGGTTYVQRSRCSWMAGLCA